MLLLVATVDAFEPLKGRRDEAVATMVSSSAYLLRNSVASRLCSGCGSEPPSCCNEMVARVVVKGAITCG